jgi:uncharacterized protein (TIGR02722 family)
MYRKIAFLVLVVGFVSSCGPKGFIKGEYDEDVTSDNLLNDRWSETDMQRVVKDLVAKMLKSRHVQNAKTPPVIMVTRLRNETDEHINTDSIMDMVRVELQNASEVQFVNKSARDDVAEEYEYQNSGMVSDTTKKGPGGQVGADFILDGALTSNVQDINKRKTVYYKVTLNMTNLQTNVIKWTGYKELRKKYKKRRMGL